MKLFGKLRRRMLAVGVCLLLACAPLPASAMELASASMQAGDAGTVSAQASYQFTVDNIVYSVNVEKYVFVWDVADPETLSSVVTIPSKVTDPADGTVYTVVGVEKDAFNDCLNLQDIRIGDLGTGRLYPQAFDGCKNLKVIHFLGNGRFGNPAWYNNNFDTDSITDLKLVFHTGSWTFEESNNVLFPTHVTSYFKTEFVQGDTTTTVFVKGLSKDGDETLEGTRVGSFSDPASVEVYCDAELGDEALCPQASVPALSSSEGRAWSYVPYSSEGDAPAASGNDTVSSCGTATEADLHDLTYASVKLEQSSIPYTGSQIKPDITVLDANGDAIDAQNYDVAFYAANGEIVPADRLKGIGTYTVRATGNGAYTGYCEAELVIEAPTATWYRALGVDRYATAQAASAQMTNFANAIEADKPSTSKRILVNSDDWAACVLADSLAGLFNCSIVTCSADTLPDRSKAPGLTGARQGDVLVVGSADSVSAGVIDEVRGIVSGFVSRVTGAATTPAAMAVAAYDNIKKAESGSITLNLGNGWTGYGTTCLIVSESADDAATFSALSWVYAEKAAVFFMAADGTLDADTAERIAAGGFTSVVALGATDQALSSLSNQLMGKGAVESVSRWAAAGDEYATSAAYVDSAVQTGAVSYQVLGIASTADWGILASAAAACGYVKGVLLFDDFSTSQAAAASCARIEAIATSIVHGCVFGGYDAVPASCFEDILALWDEEEDYANLRTATIALGTKTYQANAKGVVVNFKLVDANGKQLTRGTDFTVSYYDNATGEKLVSAPTSAGSYTMTCTGTLKTFSGGFSGNGDKTTGAYYNARSTSFDVVGEIPPKVEQDITFKNQSKTVKASKVKKANQTVAITKASANTKITYSITKVNKSAKKFAINKNTGKITVKKGTSKGTYKVSVKASAAETDDYEAASKTVGITIRVK